MLHVPGIYLRVVPQAPTCMVRGVCVVEAWIMASRGHANAACILSCGLAGEQCVVAHIQQHLWSWLGSLIWRLSKHETTVAGRWRMYAPTEMELHNRQV